MDLWQCNTERDDSQKHGSWMAAAEIENFVWLWMETGADLSLTFSADLVAKCLKWTQLKQ